MDNYIQWWLKYKPLDNREQELLSKKYEDYEIGQEDYSLQYLDLCPANNVATTHSVSFDVSATSIIDKLFSMYVDNKTLVIVSSDEHDSVKKHLEKSNTCVINMHNKNLDWGSIKKIVDGYTNIFCYIIGTTASGNITKDIFLKKIKSLCTNKKIIMVLDAVQEMFVLPRDYSMFDYIIGTAHAMTKGFDMGIVIRNNKLSDIGKKYKYRPLQHLELLKIVVQRMDKLFLLKPVLDMEFEKYSSILTPNNTIPSIVSYNSLYKFNITTFNLMKNYHIRIEGAEHTEEGVRIQPRFRASSFIKYPEALEKGIPLFKNIMESICLR